jgi:PAS domain S-box-containing protein
MFAKALQTASTRGPCLSGAVILMVGLTGSVAGAAWLREHNARSATERFDKEAAAVAGRIEGRLSRYEFMLRGVRGVVTAVGTEGLTRETFRAYAVTRDIDREFPGARGFGFIRRVQPGDEAEFLRRARRDGAPDFAIRQITPHSGERDVIQYVEPLADNAQAVGLDVASEDRRREAALHAMETGGATLTAPVTLVQATGLKERGFLLFLPVPRLGVPVATADQRRAATLGWSYAPLVIDEVLAGLDLDQATLSLAITDRAPTETSRFFTTPGWEEAGETGLKRTVPVTVFHRVWDIEVRARPAFVAGLHQVSPGLLLVVGIALSLLASAVAYLRLSGRQRQSRADLEKSRLAAIVQTAGDAIIGKTVTGLVTDWNPAAERLFGYTAQEAVGRTFSELVIPPHLRSEEAETLACIRRGEPGPTRSTLRRHRDGSLIAVLASAAPIHAEDGRVIGVASTLRDIRDQVAAAEHIQALNANLEREVAERTAELKATSALQDAILAHAGYAVIATDLVGTITLFNPAAERMLGYDASELVGKASPGLFHDAGEVAARAGKLSSELGERVEPGFDVFVARARRGLPNVDEWTYVAKDGTRLPIVLNVSHLKAEDGRELGYLGIALDLTERYRHEAEMKAAHAGTWNYGVATGSVRMSAECARQHGLGEREIEIDVETQWKPIAHPDDVVRVLGELQASIANGGSYTIEYRLPQADGSMRWLTAMGHTEANARGEITRVIGLTLDITARKQAEQALQDARAEAERANRAKTDFLAAMSHEIRTPLNAIIGFTDLMARSGRLDPDNRRQAELVQSSGQALLTVVNDILDFSKVEAGAVALEPRPFSPKALADNCLAIVRGLAEPKGLDIRAVVEPDLPEALLGDEGRLRQVLLNLLNNAVKFTRSGSITLVVRHEGQDTGGEVLRFSVIDTGIGIPPEKQYRLFQRFSQVDGSIERDFGGTGLGLAICKSLIELMGGEIGVASRDGRGSTFWFTVTLPVTTMPLASPTEAAVMRERRTGHLLLVEDSEINQILARTVLEEVGHRVDVVSDGAVGVMAVEDGCYDLVLMDVQMPGMDGLTATRMIRRLKTASADVPILAMTANVLPGQIQMFAQAGMNGHVGKPFEREALLSAIDRWLSPDGVAPAGVEPRPPASLDQEVYDQLLRMLGPAKLEGLLEILMREMAQVPEGPMDTPEDRDRLREEAHSLTAAAGAVGFIGLSAACRSLDAFREPEIARKGLDPFRARVGEVRALCEAGQRLAQDLILDLHRDMRLRATS